MKASRLLLALFLAPAVLVSQPAPRRRAFDRSATLSIGSRQFGWRLVRPDTKSKFKSSLSLDVRGEVPLTRRTGFQLDLQVAPLSGVEGVDANNESFVNSNHIQTLSVDAGFAARLKPSAPVFLYVGGGMIYATDYANGAGSAPSTEPQAVIGVGYDAVSTSPWNFRVFVGNYFVVPSQPPPPTAYVAKSLTRDWSVLLGGRRTFGSRPATP